MLTDTLPAEKQIARAATQTRLGIIFRLLRNRFVATITIMRFHLRLLLTPLVLCAVALNAFSAEPLVVPLWPEGVPDLKTNAGPEVEYGGRFTNIHNPTITLYAPAVAKSTGVAVVFSPGGGYVRVSDGKSDARWLNSLGITAFVLKYR